MGSRLVPVILLLATLVPSSVRSQAESEPVRLTEALSDSICQLADFGPITVVWKYHPGDDPSWADPTFDDSAWPDALTTLPVDSMPAEGWSGIGWFRLHFSIEQSLVGEPLALRVAQRGAVELFLNGELVYSAGRVGVRAGEEEHYVHDHPDPVIVTVEDTVGVLAVRYSNHRAELFHTLAEAAGFVVELSRADSRISTVNRIKLYVRAHQWLFTGSATILALVFYLIFLFSRRSREDLYFALLATGCALISYWPFELHMGGSLNYMLFADLMFKAGLVMVSVCSLLFLYELFYLKLPRQYWVLLALGLVLLGLSWLISVLVLYVYVVLAMVEMIRIVILASLRRRRGSGTIAIGFALFVAGCTYQIVMDWEWVPTPAEFFLFPYMAGITALLVAMSLHLAKQFADTNEKLSRQLNQVRELSEKSLRQEREAREQEVARALLEKDIEHQKKELAEAHKLEKALSDLELTHSELKQTQSQLVQSEKMASLGMLVAGIAHEINTPIGAIGSMHNTLVRGMDKLKDSLGSCDIADCDVQKIQPFLEVIDGANKVIETGAERVTTIVRRLRSFARLDEAELKEVDLHEGLEDTLTLIHHEIKNRIEVVRQYGTIPPVTCYPGRLNQVFLNLLNNARQAIEGEGTITITTRVEDNNVEVGVRDDGKGIAPEALARVFDPGFTTKGVGVGTGLGLSICYQIIKDHRGDLKVASEVGKGTVFTIVLPLDLKQQLGNNNGATDEPT
jgi:signal transduction histidine kinase